MEKAELMLALFGQKIGGEPIIVDRTRLQQYATCPFQAWSGKDEADILRDVGKETHRLTEECIKTGLDNQTQPEDMADWFVNELPKVRPDIQPQVIRAVRNIADSLLKLRPHRIIGVEEQIDWPSDMCSLDGRQFILTICLDLLIAGRESLIVTDWKSGFKKRTNQETVDDFQCQVAAFILWQMYPDINTIHWFFDEMFWGTKSYARFERNASIIHPDLTTEMQFKGRIFEALRLWQEDCRQAWPEEKKCAWCDSVLDCPHANAGVRRIATNPRKFIDRMTAMQAQLDRYKRIAKDWYKRHGTIKGSEMVYEWRQPKERFAPKLYKGNGEK